MKNCIRISIMLLCLIWMKTAIADNVNDEKIDFASKKIDFGSVSSKNTKSHMVKFKFTNNGETPVIVLKADGSCGCLSVKFPKQPIKKGEDGIIEVNIDLTKQKGYFNKTIILTTSANNKRSLLRIVGKVE